jgi:glucokinase-like ROK family protein
LSVEKALDFSMSERSRFQTGGQAYLRQINLSAIMNYIREEPPISRSNLAEKTGLNKATVSSLVSELIDHKYVHEVGVASSGLGRPQVMLSINPAAGFIVGGEVGVDFILVIATDFEPRQIFRKYQKIETSEDADCILQKLIQQIKDAIDFCDEKGAGKFLGLAVGLPGLVEFAEGRLLCAPNLGWRDLPVKACLEKHFKGIPVFVDNEANMALLGEYYFGAANKAEDVLYISAGVGLGGSIMRSGHVFHGPVGIAGEFGHIVIDPNGELCACGNRGCWETLASQKALYRFIKQAIESGANSILEEFTKGDASLLSVEMVVEAVKMNDKVAIDALANVAHYLGVGIASLIDILNPQLVLVGGSLSTAWEYMEAIIDSTLKENVLLRNQQTTKVILAKHEMNACVMGAIGTVFQAIFSEPQ